MTGNKDDADDITQETFIQAFKSLDKFKGESQIYTWLYKIAKNNCIRFLEKKKKITFLSLQKLTDNASSPVAAGIPETEKMHYIKQVKDGCLSALLRSLSLQQRLAFILNVLLGLSLEQVSNVIDKSENATRILVHRSKQNIRNYLCANCSLFDPENSCHCENLINFSLKQNWIRPGDSMHNVEQTEAEIKSLNDVVGLYKTLEEKSMPNKFDKHLKRLLADKKDFLILREKKVK